MKRSQSTPLDDDVDATYNPESDDADNQDQERSATERNPMRYPIGYKFIPLASKKRRDVYTVADYLTTTNLGGTVVRSRYVCTHVFCGQVLQSEECEATIARGEAVTP